MSLVFCIIVASESNIPYLGSSIFKTVSSAPYAKLVNIHAFSFYNITLKSTYSKWMCIVQLLLSTYNCLSLNICSGIRFDNDTDEIQHVGLQDYLINGWLFWTWDNLSYCHQESEVLYGAVLIVLDSIEKTLNLLCLFQKEKVLSKDWVYRKKYVLLMGKIYICRNQGKQF